MPDPFAVLPLPLPIFILNDLQDLASLHAILVSSPITYRIFKVHYIEILASILPHYQEHLLHLSRIVLDIRSRPAPIQIRYSMSEHAFNDLRAMVMSKNTDGAIAGLSKTITTVTAARSFVKTAVRVHGLMNGFFEVHLKRLNELKPHCARTQKLAVEFEDSLDTATPQGYCALRYHAVRAAVVDRGESSMEGGVEDSHMV
ncbi:MAG: hypothetical protein Q9169_005725 [Polycauliona sp. 2 TL-2023]